ncbi:MAG TPA: PASTA domain-containing protein [Longimicrobiaceae bacterium]|nr:PASTA domain-containing protein [Longimicrobiaceae bacterium]
MTNRPGRRNGRLSFTPDRKRLFRRVVGLGLGAFALGYLLTTLIVFPGFGRQAIVTVPDLRGRTLQTARRAAGEVDLQVEQGTSLSHPTLPAGAVLAQSPLPGQEVTRGAVIRVTLSAGRQRRAVPEVGDLTAAEARDLLTRLGFVVRVRRTVSERAEGRVLGVRPEPGTQLPVPSLVELTLSAGPPVVVVPRVAVPDLTGLPEPAVREALEQAGLRLGSVDYADSDVPLGGVASQRPAAGDSARAGTAVDITISGTAPPGAVQPPPSPDTASSPPPGL